MYTVEVVGDKRHINDKTPEDEIEFDSDLGFTQERWMQKNMAKFELWAILGICYLFLRYCRNGSRYDQGVCASVISIL